jgi:hypothetical protein
MASKPSKIVKHHKPLLSVDPLKALLRVNKSGAKALSTTLQLSAFQAKQEIQYSLLGTKRARCPICTKPLGTGFSRKKEPFHPVKLISLDHDYKYSILMHTKLQERLVPGDYVLLAAIRPSEKIGNFTFSSWYSKAELAAYKRVWGQNPRVAANKYEEESPCTLDTVFLYSRNDWAPSAFAILYHKACIPNFDYCLIAEIMRGTLVVKDTKESELHKQIIYSYISP